MPWSGVRHRMRRGACIRRTKGLYGLNASLPLLVGTSMLTHLPRGVFWQGIIEIKHIIRHYEHSYI